MQTANMLPAEEYRSSFRCIRLYQDPTIEALSYLQFQAPCLLKLPDVDLNSYQTHTFLLVLIINPYLEYTGTLHQKQVLVGSGIHLP